MLNFSDLLNALAASLEPLTFLMMLIGCIGGIVIGAIPGLSGSTGIILLLPLIYNLDMIPAMVVMAGMFCGSMYGGSIPAILLKTPGTPSAAATALEGYPLAEKGEAGKALTVSLVSSVLGGIISGVALMTISPSLAQWALKFQAPEYFAMAIFGLTLIAGTGQDLLKGLISGLVGLFFSTIGIDVLTGSARFTFNSVFLIGGIGTLPMLVGLFALTQVFNSVSSHQEEQEVRRNQGSFKLTRDEWGRIIIPIIVSAVLGLAVGIIPGAGGAIACFLAYEVIRNMSKHPEEFGKGSIEGLAAAESSNNATTGGALVPLLTLGVPGDAVTAVMLGAFMLIGIRPGPALFTETAHEMTAFFVSFIIMQFVILLLGIVGRKLWVKILDVPNQILMPMVLLFSFLGAFSLANNTRDVMFTLIFGVIGYFMSKYGYPAPPMILGLILGPMAEQNLNRTLSVYDSWTVIFTRPISCVLLVVSILSVGWSVYKGMRKQD